jgi:transglycosylase-like protein
LAILHAVPRLAKIVLAVMALLCLAIGAFFLMIPQLGAWVLRTRVLPKLEERLDRRLTIGEIKVHYGSASLKTVVLQGIRDEGHEPLARIGAVQVSFDFWPALVGDVRLRAVTIEQPRFALRRDATGDNFSDLPARLRGKAAAAAPAEAPGRDRMPDQLRVVNGWLVIDDDRTGVRAGADGIDAELRRGSMAHATLTGVHAEHRLGPRFTVTSVQVEADPKNVRGTVAVSVTGGTADILPKLALTGIAGRVAAAGEPGKATIALRGGYGGVGDDLWRAEGTIDLDRREGDVHLRADRFTFDKVADALAGTPVVAPEDTSLDAALDLSLKDGVLRFAGALDLDHLSIFHPWLAEEPVRDLGFQAKVRGSFATRARVLTLDDLSVSLRGLSAHLDGEAALIGGEEPDGTTRVDRRLKAHLVVPQVPCQTVLAAMPPELTPRLQGFVLKGNFSTDLHVDVDWADLDNLDLGGSVGIFGCKVIEAPDDMKPDRLLAEFEQVVEVEENNFVSFQVGPSNPDFVPYAEVSPYLLNSLMTTEDSGFMKHHGFINREFKSALIKDLKEGYFKYGASSITMQIAKNVFLYRQKTLARKLQELFLTWYIETILPKERLLEIYVNVIEFGPGLYGIGAAARHYFGKKAKDLNPVESAFFSSILPNPKKRYMQYCEGELNRWGDAKVQRIVKLEHERGLLSDEEYARALQTPLVFDRTEALPEAECKAETMKLIKATRPTQPGQPAPAPAPAKPAKAAKRHHR